MISCLLLSEGNHGRDPASNLPPSLSPALLVLPAQAVSRASFRRPDYRDVAASCGEPPPYRAGPFLGGPGPHAETSRPCLPCPLSLAPLPPPSLTRSLARLLAPRSLPREHEWPIAGVLVADLVLQALLLLKKPGRAGCWCCRHRVHIPRKGGPRKGGRGGRGEKKDKEREERESWFKRR